MRDTFVKSFRRIIIFCLIICLLVLQLPIFVDAQVASPSTSSYVESSSYGPQRFSASASGGNVYLHLHDENATNYDRLTAILRDNLDDNLSRVEEYFSGNNCNIIVDVSGYSDGHYDIWMWKHTTDNSYKYLMKMGIILSGGSVQIYSLNGAGQQSYMDNINANYNPYNYTGRSYWSQLADNYDEIATKAAELTANCSTDEEKIRAIHDWICINFAYDYEAYNSGDNSKAADINWLYQNKRAVCSGFSRLANLMLRSVGIPVMNVQGRAYIYSNSEDYDTNHEWNLLYYNGSWHIFDFTHDCQNEYYGVNNPDNKSGLEPKYVNYDMSAFYSGMKYITINSCDAYNDDGYGREGYRLYNGFTGEHFYTMSYDEASSLWNSGWRYEGKCWKSPLKSPTPVYRLFNPYSTEHHYTTNAAERDYLINAGWNYEGVAWYSDDKSRVEVYRLFNPNSSNAGSHHYTTNAAERDQLMFFGWNYEGVGWYGV